MDTAQKIRRFSRTVLVVLFVLILGIEFFGTVFSEKKKISLSEKRPLASLPEFDSTWESLQAYPQAFENFWKDHFFLRRQLVAMNSLLRIYIFHRSPIFVTLPGDNGWYYMVGDWALQDYLGTIQMTSEGLSRWKHVIAQRRRWVGTWGGHYLLVIAPNKMMVYPENLPLRIRLNRGTTMLDALNKYLSASPLRENVLDLRERLQREKLERQMYFKTDTHWNSYGAYQGYREILQRIQQWYPEVKPLATDRLHLTMEFAKSGDLAMMMGLSGILREKAEEWTVRSPCAAPGDQQVMRPYLHKAQYPLKNGCRQGAALRVLVISDSFGAYLHPYLSETFQEVIYETEVEFNDFKKFISEYHPDIIIHLHVGRFMERSFVVDAELDRMQSSQIPDSE